MSKLNNKFIRIEKKIVSEGNIRNIISDGCEAIGKFVQTCQYLQEIEFKEAKLIGFGFFHYPDDPEGTYRIFMHLEAHNYLKKYFEKENYEDISISITDLPNDFTKIEESNDGTQ